MQSTAAISNEAPTLPVESKTGANCHHCGNLCADGALLNDQKAFCCDGCLTVYEILRASGLDEFYRLNERAGRKVANITRDFSFLDDSAVQQQLIDFQDGKSTRVTLRLPAIHCIACVWLLGCSVTSAANSGVWTNSVKE